MKRDKEYDELVSASGVVCAHCCCRNEKVCKDCIVRTIIDDYYNKK